MLGAVTDVFSPVREQLSILCSLWQTASFRVPLLVIWVATFGGALHAPVTTFFYFAIGADEVVIGRLLTIKTLGGLLLAPLYGWLLDKHGAFAIMFLSCLLCALGCLVRGLASDLTGLAVAVCILGLGSGNLWTCVQTYISVQSPRERRGAVMSNFLVQVSVLSILGKLCYPMWDLLLIKVVGHETPLLRFRITLSVCTFFCFFGCVALLFCGASVRSAASRGTAMRHSDRPRGDNWTGQEPPSPTVLTAVRPLSPLSIPLLPLEAPSHNIPPTGPPSPSSHPSSSTRAFCLLCLALSFQATALTGTEVLWPVFLRDVHGFGATEYSIVLLCASLSQTVALGLLPAVERRCTRRGAVLVTSLAASMLCALAFCFQESGGWSQYVHILLTVVLLSSLSLLEPAIKALASLVMPHRVQGAVFGVLACVQSLGRVVGALLAPAAYKASKGLPSEQFTVRPDAWWLLSALLLCLVVCVQAAAGCQRASEGGQRTCVHSSSRPLSALSSLFSLFSWPLYSARQGDDDLDVITLTALGRHLD